MRKETEDFMARHGMLEKDGRILAALSGGADSVCLLYLLAGMREKWGLKIRAIHVNHGLRGEEAERDQRFSREFARSLDIPFLCERADVRLLAAREGISEEEAARNLRYRIFTAAAGRWEEEGAGPRVRIAVAHHRDDQAETVLHHLFRGSGLRGLSGIRPVRGRIIRPLLWTGRREIQAFLWQEHLSWVRDSTNDSDAYTRNRIRNQILPLACGQINSRAPEHICQAAERICQADEYLEAQAGQWMRENRADIAVAGDDAAGKAAETRRKPRPENGFAAVCASALRLQPEIIQAYVVRQMMREAAEGMRDLSDVHVRAVLALLRGRPGSRADLPGGLCAWRDADALCLGRRDPCVGRKKSASGHEEPVEETALPKLEFTLFNREKGMEIPQKQYTKWFDYDKIQGALSVRTRQTGDYFLLPGGGRKTVKSYMIDQKIPVRARDQIFLLTEGSHVLWIIGWRISEGVKVTPQTRRILQVHVSGGKEDGR